jgi:hypothetical protein
MEEMNQQSPILPWETEGRERGGREGVGESREKRGGEGGSGGRRGVGRGVVRHTGCLVWNPQAML